MTKPILRCFYRPHERVKFTGEITDPWTGEVSTPPSMTKQSFVAECDINNIIKQFSATGMFTHVSAKAAQGAYQDLPDPMELQDALQIQISAEMAFQSLPAKLRDRFANDPGRFLDFLHNPENEKEARELGLLNPLPPPPAPAVPQPELELKAPGPSAPASGAPQSGSVPPKA